MKASLVKINHFIPLLTDTLPYEVPFFFSNRGLYDSLKVSYDKHFKAQKTEKAKGKVIEGEDISLIDFFVKHYFSTHTPLQALVQKACDTKITIPYKYEIKKTDRGHRVISLIHPAAQIKICDLYKKYKGVILFYCSRSPYSIRYPSKEVSRLVTKHASLLNKIFKEAETADIADLKEKVVEDHKKISLSEVPSSYFVLEKFRMLHDFYDSPDFLELEKRFFHCKHFDVKRCFDSIYTHSIAWAIKGKDYIKKNLQLINKAEPKSFEDEFDGLMQFSNYRETNGIPIGAEASRLFAEIILQKIDLNIQSRIEKMAVGGKPPIKGHDFEIKRYMDDFFIFSNDKALSDEIQEICESELKEYKLFVNESKTNLQDRPFVTPTSSAKQKISRILSDHLKIYHLETDEQKSSKRVPRYKDGQAVINHIRGTIHDYNLTFYDISNVALGILKNNLLKSLKSFQQQKKTFSDGIVDRAIKTYIKNIISISFYIFHLSPRSHTSSTIFKISYTILEILKVIDQPEITGEIKQELFSQYMMFCEKISYAKNEKIIEFLDIVLFLSELGDEFKITEDRLMRIFKIDKNSNKALSYFEIVVLLAYIKKDNTYAELRKIILKSCEEKLSSFDSLKEAENFLLFFDLVKSPHLEVKEKKKILGYVGLKNDKEQLISFIEGKEWFFDWQKQERLDLKAVLEIKEVRTGY